jgi:hypothetical protein
VVVIQCANGVRLRVRGGSCGAEPTVQPPDDLSARTYDTVVDLVRHAESESDGGGTCAYLNQIRACLKTATATQAA